MDCILFIYAKFLRVICQQLHQHRIHKSWEELLKVWEYDAFFEVKTFLKISFNYKFIKGLQYLSIYAKFSGAICQQLRQHRVHSWTKVFYRDKGEAKIFLQISNYKFINRLINLCIYRKFLEANDNYTSKKTENWSQIPSRYVPLLIFYPSKFTYTFAKLC